MSYTVGWYIENEIIYAHYSGEASLEETRNSLLEVAELLNSSPRHLIHVYNDVGDVTQPLRAIDTLAIVRELGVPTRLGWSIVLREKSILVKLAVAFGTSVFKSRNRIFDSLDEANEFMKQMDPTLSWDKVNISLKISTSWS